MRGRTDTAGRPRLWHLYLGLALIAVSVLVGLLNGWGLRSMDADPPGVAGGPGGAPRTAESSTSSSPSSPTSPTSDATGTTGTTAPTVLDWGGTGRQLAVVVRNDADRTVREAEVVITARDADGEVLARVTEGPRSTCCTVLGLPPNQRYGLFFRLPVPVSRVADVDVEYRAVTLGARRWSPPRVVVDGARLRRTGSDTVVEAQLRLSGTPAALRSLNGHIAGQAFLVDRAGRLVAVISGRFYCLTAEEPRRTVAMQLLRPVPPGTRISQVVAYAVPRSADLPVPHTCPGSARPTK